MRHEAHIAPLADRLSAAFEHSITWEDDVWRADPVDVELVHAPARRKFAELLSAVTADRAAQVQARILLFHGQSGAGKTHLIRALRTSAHRAGKAYFGYAQMTPDVANYADYYLRRLVASLEKPYDPDKGGESALARLTNGLVGDAAVVRSGRARQAARCQAQRRRSSPSWCWRIADEIVAAPKFAGQNLDINIVRALLYLQRSDPRIDQRVRQYLYGRQLNDLSQEAVAALDPNTGEGRAFEIIESLGRLMWTVDRAALVFCIDQVEDLRFFDDYTERFQKAARDLIQIANRVPTSIVLVSCLGDFYGKVREVLAQSYIDRIEKAGPVPLIETRTAEEARLIIAKRLQQDAAQRRLGDPTLYFGPQFFEEFGGLSTRRILELAQTRMREQEGDAPRREPRRSRASSRRWRRRWAFGGGRDGEDGEPARADRVPRPLGALHGAVAKRTFPATTRACWACSPVRWHWRETSGAGAIDVTVEARRRWPTICRPSISRCVTQRGFSAEARIFLCNRPTQGGGLKRQLDRVLTPWRARAASCCAPAISRPTRRTRRRRRSASSARSGGRSLLVPIPDWERMMMVREFHAQHRQDPGFADWFQRAKLLSEVLSLVQLLRLDLLGRSLRPGEAAAAPAAEPADAAQAGAQRRREPAAAVAMTGPHAPTGPAGTPRLRRRPIRRRTCRCRCCSTRRATAPAASWPAARLRSNKSITLNKDVLKRHAAVLGGSGSGKTTLALCIIEQLLLRGTPAVLIDRKGDLCSYANPDVWRALEGEFGERRGEREKLADSIDVAVYTPGRASGRPISITLLPNGINELPEQEQQLLANLSAAALGDMLHLKNSATHQKQSGTLSVALRILGGRFSKEVTLADLIELLEDEDPELTDLTQRMDPSGRIRRDLVAQLDSLRHRNSALFEGGGEPLRMERLLGSGPHARTDNRTRLSIIYTGFLGDNENILFWVSQFLSEALRFCQRNPNDELQAVVMFDEADLYIPANAKPATAEPLQSLLKRARSAGLGIMLATQSPGDLDYKSRDQITSWFIGRVREDTALRKLRAAFQSESGLDPSAVLPGQTVGEFHLVQEGLVRPMRAQRSLITAEQVPFDRIEQLARETKGQDEKQLKLFA